MKSLPSALRGNNIISDKIGYWHFNSFNPEAYILELCEDNDSADEKKVVKLFVSNKKIGYESKGYVALEDSKPELLFINSNRYITLFNSKI